MFYVLFSLFLLFLISYLLLFLHFHLIIGYLTFLFGLFDLFFLINFCLFYDRQSHVSLFLFCYLTTLLILIVYFISYDKYELKLKLCT